MADEEQPAAPSGAGETNTDTSSSPVRGEDHGGGEARPEAGTTNAPKPDGDPRVKPADRAMPDLSGILGQAACVMMHSPAHKHMFISDLEWLLVPPIGLKQFRLWRRDNLPVAFASWAFLSEDVAARFADSVKQGQTWGRRLAPADWRSGDQLWLIDLVCPFGGIEEAARQLKSETFKGRKVKTLRPAPDGQGLAVVEW